MDKYQTSENLQYESIDEMLDLLIFKDRNLDGAVSLVRHFGTQGLYQTLAEIIKSCECKCEDKLDTEKLLRKLENSKQNKDEISKEEAITLLHRLKQGGNIESLTLKEQEALKKYFAGEISRIKEENPSLENALDKVIGDFVEKIYSKESFILNSMV